MPDCPLCGGVMPASRPRHRVVLAVADKTRSLAGVGTDGPTAVRRHRADEQVCRECWEDLKERLEDVS